MQIQFENREGITKEHFTILEGLFGKVLPADLRDFLHVNGNAKPLINGKLCCIKIKLQYDDEQETVLSQVFGFSKLREMLPYINYLDEYVEHWNLKAEDVESQYLFPFAEMFNGAVYAAVGGRHAGKIYTADNGDFGLLYHSDSLVSFWSSVYECEI